MKTCVLCLSLRNAFECTMRSRSRWNAVRSGCGGSSRSRPLVSDDRTARSDSVRRSISSIRSLGVVLIASPGHTLAPGTDNSGGQCPPKIR